MTWAQCGLSAGWGAVDAMDVLATEPRLAEATPGVAGACCGCASGGRALYEVDGAALMVVVAHIGRAEPGVGRRHRQRAWRRPSDREGGAIVLH